MKAILRNGSIALLALAALGGCATLSESECRHSDWYDIGHRDGRQGAAPDRVSRHAEACAEHGIAPDRERYLDGHREGLVSYCTRHSGLAAGQSGATYQGVCPDFAEAEFMQGYSLGQALHRARGRLQSLESEIRHVDARIRNEDRKKDEPRRTEVEIATLVVERVQLERERTLALEDLRRLEWDAREL
jgi:hypothetical protein